MVEPSAVAEVCSINRKLIIRVELCFHGVVAGPGIASACLQDEHAVIHSWAVERAEGIDLRWRRV